MARAWRFGLVFQDLCDHGSESRWVLDTRVGEAGGLGSKNAGHQGFFQRSHQQGRGAASVSLLNYEFFSTRSSLPSLLVRSPELGSAGLA